jgi:hypothetical protein
MRVALVVPYFDTTDGAPPNETVARQETVRGLVGSLNRGGVSARGFQMHRERASVSVPGGGIDLAPGPGGSMAVARLLHRFFPRHGPAYWIPAVELWRMVVRWRPHVMHVMGIALHPNLALGRLVASRTNIGVVASFHGGLPPGAGPTRLV